MSYHVVEDSRSHGPSPTPRPTTRKHYIVIERPCLYCGLVIVLCTTLGHFHPIAIGSWSATLSEPPLCSCSWLLMGVTMTIPQPGAAEAEAWSGCWSWHAPCDPDGWRRSGHLLIGPLVTLCDVVWCCVTNTPHFVIRCHAQHPHTWTPALWRSGPHHSCCCRWTNI